MEIRKILNIFNRKFFPTEKMLPWQERINNIKKREISRQDKLYSYLNLNYISLLKSNGKVNFYPSIEEIYYIAHLTTLENPTAFTIVEFITKEEYENCLNYLYNNEKRFIEEGRIKCEEDVAVAWGKL